jgi:hypothetical protein
MKAERMKRIADYDGAKAHLVVAYHDNDKTLTTLCCEEHVPYYPVTTEPLCEHCTNVLRDLNATAN